jgi:putative peptide-modifying radical SAM enzyme
VSVDGAAATTDRNRGTGVYARAVAAVRELRLRRGYTGDLVARMTVGEWSDVHRDVSHLVDLADAFDHVHWQLDVLWDSPKHARWTDFLHWRDTSYNPGITHLAEDFAAALRQGRVLGIAPFLGLAWSILAGRPATHVRCSSGHRAFNVTTGGLVTTCPIAADCEPVGCIADSKPFDPVAVHGSLGLGGDGRCDKKCEVFGDCGGRCLYASRTDWWGADGFDEVC